MKYRFLIAIIFCLPLSILAQKASDSSHFNIVIRDDTGDLNNDKIDDKIVVLMDTLDDNRPMRLQVFLSQSNKKQQLSISSDQAIEAMYPKEKNGKYSGHQIPSIFIEEGILKIWMGLEKGNIIFDFKYQKGNFELIKVLKISHNATVAFTENTVFTETEYNLITDLKTETITLPHPEKEIKKQSKIAPQPLTKLQDFKFSDRDKF